MKTFKKLYSERNLPLTFDKTFIFLSFVLNSAGMHPRGHTKTPLRTIYALVLGILYFPVTLKSVYEVGQTGNLSKIGESFQLLPVLICFAVHLYNFIKNQKRIRNLIENIDKDYSDAKNMEMNQRSIVAKYANSCCVITNMWVLLLTFNNILFAGGSLWKSLRSAARDSVFTPAHMTVVAIPEFGQSEMASHTIRYALDGLLEVYIWNFFTSLNIFIPICLFHTNGQLEIIKHKIMSLKDLLRVDVRQASVLFQDIIRQSQVVCESCSDVSELGAAIYQTLELFTIAVTPVSLFIFILNLRQGQLEVQWVVYGGSWLLTMLFPAYCSELIIQKFSEVAQAAYGCGWEKVWRGRSSRHNRDNLRMVIMRFQRPTVLKTHVGRVDLTYFRKLCGRCYNIFTLLIAFVEI